MIMIGFDMQMSGSQWRAALLALRPTAEGVPLHDTFDPLTACGCMGRLPIPTVTEVATL